METDGAGGSGSGAGGSVGVGSAGSLEPEKKTTPDGELRVKRKMKTPYQLELLEKTYAMETYPSEELRAELSVKLGLSDRQLQMWFCHRRLKDRKAPAEKQQTKRASPAAVAGSSGRSADEMAVNNTEVENEHGSGLSLFGNSDLMPRPTQQHRVVHKVGTVVPRITAEMPVMRRFYEPPLAISEQRAIAFVEAQLGEPMREDGPILGMEFDPLPPGAFGAPIVTPVQQKHAGRSHEAQLYERPDPKITKGASQAIHEFQFLPENPSLRSDSYERAFPSHYYGSPADVQSARFPSSSGRSFKHGNEQVPSGHNLQAQTPILSLLPHQGRQGNHLSPASGEVDIAPRITPLANVNINANYVVRPATGPGNQIITPDRHAVHEERLEKKCKSEEARIAREVEAHEKRIRKELEKQDILRRKREEQMRKDMERQDRERRKEEERLLREKQREEERYQREQRREMERREKFLQKEYIKAEKKRLKEEMRREKEAARLRAANDRAAARRIAKESTELVEDEQLELMEFAASHRGLSSVLALDNETLQNLDMLKDKLPDFPPKSVLLKKPFGVQPWADSEESVGNLLMVWRFLITFADVLGLWPFTLDEFAQAFHDYDPRLLGEIHIAILRCIIKDIEDVARTPANALGANQNSVVNPGGGHPQIVEGAYAWGFDICSWQRHLTPLTWPEVLRQFALAAGFGPKLKKRSMQPAYHHDEIEGNDGTDIISNLRNGVAAEKAVAIMQERGLSNPRRSRHRLTPGTVKFAAFHVLSLEGCKGLTILEVADKIQKSGLRDLTTSKTPEASISAALSRDTKLFERTAPSTYCLRSPYRKDPADTEAILSSAREKIQLFQNKYVDGIGADDAEKEDAERDQESESDILDDPDIDDLDAELKLNKGNIHSKDTDRFEVENLCGYGKDNSCSELIEDPLKNSKINSSSMQSLGFRDIKSCGTSSDQIVDVIGIHSQTTYPDQDLLIDECSYGESWVQGLVLGEYASLSIEERLDALVSLIGVVNEGNAIRSTLEERLEAANALKKQMLAEAQIDRRRTKEEFVIRMQQSSFTSNRAEQNLSLGAFEDRRISLLGVDRKNESASADSLFQMDLNGQQSDQNYGKDLVDEKNLSVLEYSVGLDNPSLQQSLYAAEKSQSELKAYIGHRAEEMYVYRSLPLGQDRRRNRYWQFIASPSQNDPGSGRIFVELQDGQWRLIDTEEGFDALLALLDVRGVRESHLRSMLQRIETSFKEAARKNLVCANSGQHVGDEVKKEVLEMESKPVACSSMESLKNMISIPDFISQEFSSSAIELSRNGTEDKGAMERYRDSEKWMWEECFNSNILCALKYGTPRSQQLLEICDCSHAKCFCEDNHCPCHRTSSSAGNNIGFSEHVTQCKRKLREESDGVLHKLDLSVPPRIRLLKAQLATIEASIPQEALEPIWSDTYRKSWSMKLLMALTAEDLLRTLTLLEGGLKRDFLSANFETTSELLGSCNLKGCPDDNSSKLDAVMVLPWIPLAISAVALRLMELDTSICYTPEQKKDFQKDSRSGYFIKLPSRCSSLGNGLDNILPQVGNLQQDNLNGRTSLKRGRGRPRGSSRPHSGKSQRKAINSRNESGQVITTNNYELPGWKGRPRGQGGCKKGRRSVRSRQKPVKRAVEVSHEKAKDITFDEIPNIGQQEWNLAETPIEAEGAESTSSSEISAFDDYNGPGSADEFDEAIAHNVDFRAGEDDEVEHEEDGDGDDYIDDDVEGYFNGDYHEPGNTSTGGEQVTNINRSSDRGSSSSSSSDYSY